MAEELNDNDKKPKTVTKAARKRAGKAKALPPKSKVWTFPKNTLEEAIHIPKAIEEKNAGNPMHAEDTAKAVGFKKANDWRFLDLLKSANFYGLVEGTGEKAIIEITKIGQDVIAPASPQDRQKALLSAFRNVPTFAAVEKFYGGKRIPEDEFFINTLTRQFNVERDRVEKFSGIFRADLNFLKAFDATNAVTSSTSTEIITPHDKGKLEQPIPKEPRVREFLDTCFVMMPFGNWSDLYASPHCQDQF